MRGMNGSSIGSCFDRSQLIIGGVIGAKRKEKVTYYSGHLLFFTSIV